MTHVSRSARRIGAACVLGFVLATFTSGIAFAQPKPAAQAQTSIAITTTPPGAKVTVNGFKAGVSPVRLQVRPGVIKIGATLEGYDAIEREVTVAPGKVTPIELAFETTPPPAPTPAAPPPSATPAAPPPPAPSSASENKPASAPSAAPETNPAPPSGAKSESKTQPGIKVPDSMAYVYATGGVAVVAAGVGALFGVQALSASSDYKKDPTVEKVVDGEKLATISTVSFVVFGVFAAATATLLVLRNPSAASKSALPSFTNVVRF